MNARKRQVDKVDKAKAPPAGYWRSPSGKLLSKQDQIPIRLPAEDLSALRRAIDATLSHLDEGRGLEERVPFAARLARLQKQGRNGELIVDRRDLHALHQALHVAAGHLDNGEVRGSDGRAVFIERLAQIRKTAINAVCDHDDVPRQDRCYS